MELTVNRILENYCPLTVLATEALTGTGEGKFDIKYIGNDYVTLRFNGWSKVNTEKLQKCFPLSTVKECVIEQDERLDLYSYEIH